MADRVVKYRLEADLGRFKTQMAEAGSAVKKAADDMTALDKSGARTRAGLTTVGDAAGKMGLVAAAGLGASIKAAMDWESAWTGVTKTVDGSASQMAELEQGLRDLAKTLPATHAEIAGVAEAAGQLGVARDDILDFTKTMIDLGETTNLTAEDAATSIAQFSNVMSMSAADVDNFGSTLVALGNAGASTEAEIMGLAQRLSGAGALVGAAPGEVLALASSLADLGIEAELGGGAVQRVFIGIDKAVADGGDTLAGFAQTAGMSAEQFAEQWRTGPIQAFDALIGGLGEVEASGGNVTNVLDDLGVKGTQNLSVMLRLAGAGDQLTTSLQTQAEAWRENTALTEEAEKRYGTTQSQITISWNKIRDAGISAGESLLPVAAGVAEAIGGIASAFGSLPGPVQKATTGLAGVTAVLGGGLWFSSKVVNGISEGREALEQLGVSSGTASKAMKGVAAAGAGLAALTVAAAGIRAIQEATDETVPGLETLRGRLVDMATAPEYASLAGLGDEFDSLGESIARIADKNFEQGLTDTLQTPFEGLFGEAGSLREAKTEIDALDRALASLASEGHADLAAESLERLADSQGLSKSQTDDLRSLLPQYEDALAGVANSAKLTTAATDDLGGASGNAAVDVAALAEAQEKARKAAVEQAESFITLGDSLNDAKVSLGEWIGQMASQAQALKDFRKNAIAAAREGLDEGLIASLQQAGPEGAMRMQQLANASKREIGRANDAFRAGQREVDKYADAFGKVPGDVSTDVHLNGVEGAVSQVQSLAAQVRAVDGMSATAYVNVVRRGQRTGVNPLDPYGSADGSTVPKDGGPYADRYPYLLAPGEEVISNRFGQADRWRPLLKAINYGKLADGGTAGVPPLTFNPKATPTTAERLDIIGVRRELRELTKALSKDGKDRLKGLARQEALLQKQEAKRSLREAREAPLDRKREALDARIQAALDRADNAGQALIDAAKEQESAAKDQMDAAISQRDAVQAQYDAAKDAVVNNMSVDLFGGGSLGSFDKALNKGNAENTAFESAMTQLINMGLDGPLLQEVAARGSLKFAQQMLQVGAAGIESYEQRYAQMNATSARVGDLVASQEYGAELARTSEAAAKAELKHAESVAIALRQEAELAAIKAAIEQQGREFGKELNGVSAGTVLTARARGARPPKGKGGRR